MKGETKMAKKEKYEGYFEDIVVEDEMDIEIIGSNSCRSIAKDFGITFGKSENGGEDDWRVPIVIFAKVYESLLEVLEEKRDQYNSFEINFAQRFVMGFDNRVDEEDEKEGNFMVYLFHIADNAKAISENANASEIGEEEDAAERCRRWVSENVIDTPETMRAVSQKAIEKLEKIDLELYRDSLIPPIVSYVYDEMIEYIKQKRINNKEDEVEINFAGCFFNASRETEDGKGEIVIRPSIESKMALKDDATSNKG